MENKKEYTEPKMKTVHLENQVNLLEGSENNGEFGLAPHEQDPLA